MNFEKFSLLLSCVVSRCCLNFSHVSSLVILYSKLGSDITFENVYLQPNHGQTHSRVCHHYFAQCCTCIEYVCIYQCVYVCMCVCLFVCIYVCMYVYMCVCAYFCMYIDLLPRLKQLICPMLRIYSICMM